MKFFKVIFFNKIFNLDIKFEWECFREVYLNYLFSVYIVVFGMKNGIFDFIMEMCEIVDNKILCSLYVCFL